MARTALIVGASRGIGLGLVKAFVAQGWQVTGTVREPAQAEALAAAGARAELLDITDAARLQALRDSMGSASLDLLFINAGVSGPAHHSAAAATAEELGQLMLTNATGPVRLARAFLDLLRPGAVLAFTTSRMGSVTDNQSGDMELYRASKAALNSLTRSLVATADRPDLSVLSLHPGWVRTDMGGPNADISVEESAQGMAAVVESHLDAGRSGFLDYAGHTIPW